MAETRITAGVWRGRVVYTGRSMATRPTTARVREALFNILGATVARARVLDLFAGAGTIGFEALSRGAAAVTFVERDRPAAALITRTAGHLGCADRVRLVVDDVAGWITRHQTEVRAVDLCYVDAPYGDDGIDQVLARLGGCAPALVVCEHHRARRLPDRAGGLERTRQAGYGMAQLSFYRRGAESTGREGRG
ncbi:MAG: 16S rRNA (guanine(966)-N(2))-methyltransferase RsmD [Candidatus Dormibacteria bacterium]